MLFGSHNLKRKLIAIIDPTYTVINDHIDDCNAHERVQIEEPASFREEDPKTVQGACAAGDNTKILSQEEEDEEESLRQVLKEWEEKTAQIIKKAKQASANLKKFRSKTMACVVCHDVIKIPQTLRCGHSACYACLRKAWTKPTTENPNALMIETDAESDLDDTEADTATDMPHPAEPIPPPRVRRRHRFSSAVNRKKCCPYCKKEVELRPMPNFRLREMLEITSPNLLAKTRHAHRQDLWHGIFHSADELFRPQVSPEERAAEEDKAARERVKEEAFQEGLRLGALEEQAKLDRENREMVVRPVRLMDIQFWQWHPPPADI